MSTRRAQGCAAPSLLVILLLTLLAPSSLLAYTVRTSELGAIVHWSDDQVDLRLDSSLQRLGGQQALEAIIEAVTTWEHSGFLPTHIELSEGEGAEAGYFPGQENHNDVIGLEGPWPFSSEYTAVTISTFDAATGELLDADILFDASRPWSAAGVPGRHQVDLLDTATHELGHFFGLEHSEVGEATMYAVGPQGSTERRSLHSDDLEGLLATYGPPPTLGRTVDGGCHAAGAAPTGSPALMIVVLVALGVLRRT